MVNTQTSFSTFVFKIKINRWYLGFFLFASLGLWIIFKHFYPYPNIIFDSYYYISATVSNADVNAWPIGYSKILRLIGWFSHSANLVLTIQYFSLQLALLFIFFALRFFFQLNKVISNILLLWMILNPVFIYISNLLLSDAFFTAFSLVWFTNLLWILFRPRPYMIITQAVLLLVTFSLRYNALYYPLVATLAFILSQQKVYLKLAGIIFQCIIIGGFITYTTDKMEKDYKVKQFSPFGGWKLANNALYMYEHTYGERKNAVPERFQGLDQRIRSYFDHPHYRVSMWDPDVTWGSYYMYIHGSPLIQHMFSIYGPDAPNVNLNFDKFALMGPLYQEYGAYLIKKDPGAFVHYFVLPNTLRYFSPYAEVFVDSENSFDLRTDYLGQPAIKWFSLRTLATDKAYVSFRTSVFSFYPMLNTITHLFFVFSILMFFLFKTFSYTKISIKHSVLVMILLWLCDFLFSILAAVVVLRYQLFIISVELMFALSLIQLIFQKEEQGKKPAFSTKVDQNGYCTAR